MPRRPVSAQVALAAHDHSTCLANALARAERAFEAKGMKLTPLRRMVLEEVALSHDAVGAYEVLDRLTRKTGERMAPVSVYRALEVLLAAGVVHRLESRNAFFACHSVHDGSGRHVALVCESCRFVSEVDAHRVFAELEAEAASAGFAARSIVIEVAGLCRACTEASA
jgi:Fur family zinc uptake transcriptional regulator